MHLSTTSTMMSYHMTCYLRVITKESVLKNIVQVIDIVDVCDFHVVRKYYSRHFCFLGKYIIDVVVT